MTIGIICIATGKYDQFIPQLLRGLNGHFLPGYDKVLYGFTDSGIGFSVPSCRWPYPTLLRYKWITQYADKITADILYYIDVDMSVIADVDEEILPDETGLVATLHPGFWRGGWGDLGTDNQSLAYVSPSKRGKYHAGGFQGGTREAYLRACAEMAANIEDDHKRGIIAAYHDESHWNKYLSEHPFKEISTSYCYPDKIAEKSWFTGQHFEKIIVALDKDHKALRS